MYIYISKKKVQIILLITAVLKGSKVYLTAQLCTRNVPTSSLISLNLIDVIFIKCIIIINEL